MKRIRILATCLLLGALLALPGIARAHANLVRSDPPANAILPSAPPSVRLTFSEPVDPGFSTLQVFDSNGFRVDQADNRVDPADLMSLVAGLRAPLPDGVYTIAWRALSNVDGHVTQGVLSFGVGQVSSGDIPAGTQNSAPPADLLAAESVARWLNLLAAAILVGGPLFAWNVWQPAWRAAFGEASPPARLPTRLARNAVGLLLLALLALLFVQAVAVGGGALSAGVNPADVVRLVTDSRFGAVWLARLALAIALVALGTDVVNLSELHTRSAASLLLGALLLLTSALVSHAAALPDPWLPILNDWLHLLATSAWLGSLVYLAAALARGFRTLDPAERTRLAAAAVSRFSVLGLTTVSALIVTGVIQASLHVFGTDLALLFSANSPLLTTDYGHALLVKLALIVPLIGTAALNLLVLGPRLRAAALHAADAAPARRLLVRTIGTEIGLIAAILLAVGMLTSLSPARQPSAAASGLTFSGLADNLTVDLTVSPGRVGANDFTVTLHDSTHAPYDAAKEVELRFQPLSQAGLGTSSTLLAPQGDGRYTASGTFLSLSGRWAMEVAVRRPNAFDAFARFETDVTATGAQVVTSTPGAFRFRWPMLSGLLIALIGLLLGLVAWRTRSVPRRARLALAPLLALALVVPGANVVMQGFQTPAAEIVNPLAGDPAAIAAGQQIYTQYCNDCHGPQGRGNGRLAFALNPRPSDFCLHMQPGVHTDAQVFDWISNGYPGSQMPAWKDTLSETERWQVYAYVKATFGKPDCAQKAP